MNIMLSLSSKQMSSQKYVFIINNVNLHALNNLNLTQPNY